MKMMSTDNFFGSVSQVHNVASGINSRINNSSTDQSTNIAVAGDVFGNLSAALQAGVSDAEQLATLLAAVEDMKRTRGGGGFAAAYQKFISLCAEHMEIVAPFIEPLSRMFLAG
jgi:hypothetical protein